MPEQGRTSFPPTDSANVENLWLKAVQSAAQLEKLHDSSLVCDARFCATERRAAACVSSTRCRPRRQRSQAWLQAGAKAARRRHERQARQRLARKQRKRPSLIRSLTCFLRLALLAAALIRSLAVCYCCYYCYYFSPRRSPRLVS